MCACATWCVSPLLMTVSKHNKTQCMAYTYMNMLFVFFCAYMYACAGCAGLSVVMAMHVDLN